MVTFKLGGEGDEKDDQKRHTKEKTRSKIHRL